MSDKVHYAPAFPVSTTNASTGHQDNIYSWQFPGLTKREISAIAAMQGILAGQESRLPDRVAELATQYADALLDRLSKTEAP